ncbi:acyl carrier protein [Actinophytocola sp. NPDC049390]|uniref:acyl carrier protein n=1 Tax=Actinophytocola sp. NPDC049390 TaxID=3363894 RepID=UPI0037919662
MPSRLAQLVADVLEIPVAEIRSDTGPATTAEWVSLKHLQIVAAVEDAYRVSFTPREIRAIRSVGDLSEFLRGRDVAE